jgi:hypothetical protein
MLTVPKARQLPANSGIAVANSDRGIRRYGVHAGQTLVLYKVATIDEAKAQVGIDRIANWFQLGPIGRKRVVLLAECEDSHWVAVLPEDATAV